MDSGDRIVARRVSIAIGLVLTTLLGLLLIYATRRVLVWILVAVFFAVALRPAVDWTQRRVTKSRWLATLLVFLTAFGLLAAVTTLIVVPLVGELAQLVERLPRVVAEARAGHGPIGRAMDRFHVRGYAESHAEQITEYGARLRQPTIGLLRGVLTSVAGTITVAVLAYLMVLQAPRITGTLLGLVDRRHRARVQRLGHECARTVTGYLSGNLLISIICGGLTFLTLLLLGVPYAGVIALVVAIADLLPLIGATLGAVLAAGAGFLHSVHAGIVVLLFFVVYQQVENHLLQPLIFARVVRLNALTVLVSLLIAADLAGILGALMAIPAAGIIRVILRELRHGRRPPHPAGQS